MKAYARATGTRKYKRFCLIESEGTSTEPEYFSLFDSAELRVLCHGKKGRGAPAHLLKRMKEDVAAYRLRPGDCAWFVLDRDDWAEADIAGLEEWVRGNPTPSIPRGMALSNPKFEFWLLLHFEDGDGAETARACMERLKRHLPGYDKHLFKPGMALSKRDLKGKIPAAIRRARRRWGGGDTGRWPREPGKTNVFVLCEKLLGGGSGADTPSGRAAAGPEV